MADNIADSAEPLVSKNTRAPYTGRAMTDGVPPMKRKRGGYLDEWK